MADQLLNEDAFNNENSRKLFEVVDKLHSCGAKAYIDIPEIIIVGDQSAGKSSLLQSLTDIPFPVAGRLCTRFPTRIVSRRTPGGPDVTKITIEAALSGFFTAAPISEREQNYADFRPKGANLSEDGFTKAVDDAMRLMGISEDPDAPVDSSKSNKKPNFSSDVLRIELSGPKRSHFSILDVPGVFQSRTKDVTAQEMEGVKQLVAAEMERRQNIVVCVASGTSDLATQAIFEMASKTDPRGERTLGVVTKCDVTQHADMVVHLAQNDQNGDIYFQNGWFVVRNRSPKETLDRIDSQERHRREEKLFNDAPWHKLPASRRGVQALKKHLGDLLCHRMQEAFPKMLADIQERRRSTSVMLESLGQSRSTIEQKRTYLTRISQRFNATAMAVLRGRYESIDGDYLKLRKQVRDANDNFMQELKSNGHRVPFVPLPTLQHLQNATAQALQGASHPTGSSPFSPPRASDHVSRSSGGSIFGNSGSVAVRSDIPTTVHHNFQPQFYMNEIEGIPVEVGYFQSILSIQPFVGFSVDELRLKDLVQVQQDSRINGYGTGNGISSTSKSTNLFANLNPNTSSFSSSSNSVGAANTTNSKPAFGTHGPRDHSTQPATSLFASQTNQSSTPSNSTGSNWGSVQKPQGQSSDRRASKLFNGFGKPDQHNAEIYCWIRDEIKANRGTELQGTLNPDILPMLFHQQTYKWGDIAEKHFRQVENHAVTVLNGILEGLVCDRITKQRIWPRILEAGNAGETAKLRILRERFQNIRSRHLQTSNVAFEEKVAQARYLRFQAALDRYRVSKMDLSDDSDDEFEFSVDIRDTAALFSELHMSNSRNLENEIHDTLKAYYEIARDDYTEYVTQHIVENFINDEDGPVLMFSPLYVASLSDKDIEELAMEDEGVVKQRMEQEVILKRLEHAERIALKYA